MGIESILRMHRDASVSKVLYKHKDMSSIPGPMEKNYSLSRAREADDRISGICWLCHCSQSVSDSVRHPASKNKD